MTMTPASTNLAPESMRRDGVSDASILKSSYAILIAGEALPHRTQQKTAESTTTGIYVHKLVLFDVFNKLHLSLFLTSV
jgi:hypothetical protein